jgi:hypothetical protein
VSTNCIFSLPNTPGKDSQNLTFHFPNRYHLENPYWQTFDKYVIPLLAKDMDLRRLNELDASKEVRVEQDAGLWEQVKKHQTY